MKKPPFTLKQLVNTVKQLAKENPDNKYDPKEKLGGNCYYLKGRCSNGTVGCIFGQAFKRLGYPISDIHDGTRIRTLLSDLGFSIHSSSVEWCDDVQANQDIQQTWGEAIKKASSK